jgi:pyruvate ferredoxin oxidoreductase gamma subunit
MDPTVIGPVKVESGLKEGGAIIANYPKGSEDLKASMGIDAKVYTINATKMAMEHLGRPITNTAMVGAFVGASGLIKLDVLKETIFEWFGNKALAEKNVKLVEDAYNYMREVCGW